MTSYAPEAEEPADNLEARRELSTIAFPYLDLDQAAEVANAIYRRCGLGSLELDELAAALGQTLSGAFRLKIGAARVFGLIEKADRNSLRLTELGIQITSSETERQARAESFLAVPLYRQIYEKYRGRTLPPKAALEREMLSLGVSSKQTDKARQAFDRSARQAGYYESGEDRLVKPRIDGAVQPTAEPKDAIQNPTASNTQIDKDLGESREHHPFIEGLLQTLPTPNSEWPYKDRIKWLRLAANAFDLIYETDETKGIVITIGEE